MNEKELLQLKKTIDDAKSKASEQKGRLTYLMQQLEKDWGCKSVAEAKIKIEELEEEAATLHNKIQENLAEIEEWRSK